MSGATYCGGDEVGAVVFDIGSSTSRIGFAGEDTPRVDMPSAFGCEVVDEQKKYSWDWNKLCVPRNNIEVQYFMKDGLIEDWDAVENLFQYSFDNILCCDPSQTPVFLSEPSWNTKSKREKLAEILFEKFNVPAFFVCKNAVLAAFSNCKSTALILDCGATYTAAVPVFEGYVIQQAVVRSPLAGDFVMLETKKMFERNNIELVPSYMVKGKTQNAPGVAAEWTKRTNLPENITKSYHNFMLRELTKDFTVSTLQVSDSPLDVRYADTLPTKNYEFPNGYSHDFAADRLKVPEYLFDVTTIPNVETNTVLGVQNVVNTSITMCDPDLRQNLYTSLHVIGGCSLLHGFTERLSKELQGRPINSRVRVHASSVSTERRFASWIGGSIMASLGTFHQMWVSKQDYKESGPTIIEKKCA